MSVPTPGGLLLMQAFAIMEEELGQPLGAVFSSISERPIAAASLGQVCPQFLSSFPVSRGIA